MECGWSFLLEELLSPEIPNFTDDYEVKDGDVLNNYIAIVEFEYKGVTVLKNSVIELYSSQATAINDSGDIIRLSALQPYIPPCQKETDGYFSLYRSTTKPGLHGYDYCYDLPEGILYIVKDIKNPIFKRIGNKLLTNTKDPKLFINIEKNINLDNENIPETFWDCVSSMLALMIVGSVANGDQKIMQSAQRDYQMNVSACMFADIPIGEEMKDE